MAKSKNTILETEWSYFYDVQNMQGARDSFSISPSAQEAKRLAQRLGIVSLDKLSADLVIVHKSGDVSYHVKGQFKADLTQACAVTNEPVKTHIEEEFEAWFADPDGPLSFAKLKRERQMQKANEELQVLDEKDDPESIIDGKIDLGELVTQYLSLGIDPYIRAEGVPDSISGTNSVLGETDMLKNPFAALKDWKARQTGEDSEH